MLARKSALIIFTQFLNGLLGYVALKFIALYMQPWEYGIVGFAYGFVALFSVIGQLGFNQAHIKRISEGKELGRCISTFALIKLFLSGLMTSSVIAFILIWKFVLHRSFESSLHEKAIYILLLYFVMGIMSEIARETFNARKETAKAQLPYFFCTLGRVIATIYVALSGLGALALAYTYLVGGVLNLSFSFLFFRGNPISRPSLSYLKDYTKFALPMAIASTSAIVMTNIDKVFIQLFWSAKEVGQYFAVFNLSRFIIFFATAVGMLLFPTISEYHAKKNMREIKRLTLKAERYLSMVVFPIVMILVVLAREIIHILISDRYMEALPVLQILPFFVLIEALSRPFTAQLQGMDRPKLVGGRVLLMAAVNVVLNLILIPKDIKMLGLKLFGLGATGAAIATVISYLIGLFYVRVAVWKLSGIKGNARIVLHGISALVSGAVLYYMHLILTISRWYELLLISLLGFGIYFGILYIMGEFTREDFLFFRENLSVKEMVRYIADELLRR